jgi:hypothetical protein
MALTEIARHSYPILYENGGPKVNLLRASFGENWRAYREFNLLEKIDKVGRLRIGIKDGDKGSH